MSIIKTYQLFLESQKTRSIDLGGLGTAIRLYKENCSDWDLTKDQIYRGTSPGYESIYNLGYDYFYINPKGKYRESAFAMGNTYNSLIDNIPSWEGVPRRSESVIMTNDVIYAESYGSKWYVMIPYNGTELVMCPSSDIWNSMLVMNKIVKDHFGNEWYNLEEFDNEIKDFIRTNVGRDTNIIRDRIPYIANFIDDIPKDELNMKFSYVDNEYYKIIYLWVNKYPNLKFLEFIDMIFNFEDNKFKIVNSQFEMSVHSDRAHGTEIWSDGKFLGIDYDKFDEFVKLVNAN